MYSQEHILLDSQETFINNQGNKGVDNQGTIIASIKSTTNLRTKVVGVRGVENLGNIRATTFVNLFDEEIEFPLRNFQTLVINVDFPTSFTLYAFGST